MALSAATVWEVRPTVGSDNNGGGFVTGASGTDYSQQTSPQYALTGIASAGAGATVLYASAAANMVGNIAQVISGTNFTTGFFQITSVSVGVSITLDRSVCTGVGASGVINIGGALATIGAINSVYIGGNIVYVKATGNLTVSSTLTLTVSNLTFIGYTTTRGDNGQVTWTTSTNSTQLVTGNGPDYIAFYNFYFSNSASTRAQGFKANSAPCNAWLCQNCVFDGFSYGIDGDFITQNQFDRITFVSCEFKNCTTYGIANSGITNLIDCYVHNNTTAGVYMADLQQHPQLSIIRSVIGPANGNGVLLNTDNVLALWFENSVFYDNTNAGFTKNGSGSGDLHTIINCIFYDNGTYGIDYVNYGISDIVPFVANNAFGANGTAARRNYPFGTATDITLSGNPFNNAAGGDFTTNATAGAGGACRGAGFPTSTTLP